MVNKYIRIEEGSYRNQDMSGRVFPIVKDYQQFSGKPGGFVTVDCTELDGFEGLDKARVNVPDIGSLTIVNEGAFIINRDELQRAIIADQGSEDREAIEEGQDSHPDLKERSLPELLED